MLMVRTTATLTTATPTPTPTGASSVMDLAMSEAAQAVPDQGRLSLEWPHPGPGDVQCPHRDHRDHRDHRAHCDLADSLHFFIEHSPRECTRRREK